MMIVFGTQGMGRTLLLKWLACQINNEFSTTKESAVYLDITEFIREQEKVGFISAEETYRTTVRSTITPFLRILQVVLNNKIYTRSKLPKLIGELQEELKLGMLRISPNHIQISLNRILHTLAINRIKLILDNLHLIKRENQPILLEFFLQTFGRNENIDVIIGAELNKLQLMCISSEGKNGVELGHDLFVALDLEQLITPKVDLKGGIYFGADPRKDLVLGVINYFLYEYGQKSGFGKIENLKEVFDPDDIWRILFNLCKGDLTRINGVLMNVANLVLQKKSPINKTSLLQNLEPKKVAES